MKRRWRFRGGVKLPGFKRLSSDRAIESLPLPAQVVLPLRQHGGGPAEPVVSVGDRVRTGQKVAVARGFVSAPVHASVSGTVVAVEECAYPHPSGLPEPAIVIASDGRDEWEELHSRPRPMGESPADLLAAIKGAGLVGLGGAGFPAAAKLKPTRPIDTLLINGAECEPYITCDDALMRAQPEDLLLGVLVLRRILKPVECIIAVEDNKPEAAQALRAALVRLKKAGVGASAAVRVVKVPTLFPTGGEKQLIRVVTGRRVPQQGLPYEVGVVCVNVGTAAAAYEAVYEGRPLVSRIVTVTGEVARPGNYRVRLGTSMQTLVREAGGEIDGARQLIMGGPMMGHQLPSPQVPVIKTTNCLLVKSPQPAPASMPCIRCGACARACPMELLPQQLYWHSLGPELEQLERHHLQDCIECGCCAVVCPSHIPLVQHFRFAKTAVREQQEKRRQAHQSRLRTQAREARLERLKAEQEKRRQQRRAGRTRSKGDDQNESAKSSAAPARTRPETDSA